MGGHSVVVLDFETTGLSPDCGDRAIEIGAVLVRGDEPLGHFHSLMNPGMRISGFIEEYTGITNKMLSDAPPVAEVMLEFAEFMADSHLVAHNASFDRRFLDAELRRVSRRRKQDFACSMLISRRLYPDAPNHRLETLVRHRNLKTSGVYHRALADAQMTADLWIGMVNNIKESYKLKDVPFDLMMRLSKVSKTAAPAFLKRIAAEQG